MYLSVCSLLREPGNVLERVAIPAMLLVWSDVSHLANFGDPSLWPIYLYFGNLSKYTRRKPAAVPPAITLRTYPRYVRVIHNYSKILTFSYPTIFRTGVNETNCAGAAPVQTTVDTSLRSESLRLFEV